MTLPNKSDIMEAARAAQVLAQEGGMRIDDEALVKAAAAVLWHHRGPSLEGCEVLDARALIVKIAATFAGVREGVEPDDYREPLTPRIASAEEPDLDALEDSLGHLLRDARAGQVAGYGCVAVHTDGLLWHTWGAIGERSPLARVAPVPDGADKRRRPMTIPMLHNINYVLDLETFATTPRAMVRSAAIVLFTRDGSLLDAADLRPLFDHLDLEANRCDLGPSMLGLEFIFDPRGQANREVDAETMLWWMQQGDEARAAFVASEAKLRHPSTSLLPMLSSMAPKIIGWAKPQSFEMSIVNDLALAYFGGEILNRRRFRDARTYYAAAADTLGWEVFDELPEDAMGPKHLPLYDAALTARTIQRAYRELVGRRCDP